MTREFALPNLLDRTIGRDDEVSRLSELLLSGEHRLVTLTGPGGVGKTRLAIQVASRLQCDFKLGVHFLSLAPIRDWTRLQGDILSAFDMQSGPEASAIDRVALALSGQSILVVLDNMEQLLEASPFVHELISSCESMTILTTSRAPLRVAGEYVYAVRPLDLVAKGDSPLPDAMVLFRERSLAVSGGSNLSDLDEDLNTVAEICRRLDGLPLAIELAAARTRHLQPPELLARLDHSLRVLKSGTRSAPARLQSMEAAISWSYDLLSPDEQRLLRALSVFQGGFTLDAAEAMAEGLSTPGLDLVSALVDHSLIQRVASPNGSRYLMLETIRSFSTEQCAKCQELTTVRDQHCTWFASQLETPSTLEHMFSQRQITTWRLPDEHENLRIALEWALAQKHPILAAHLAEGLATYWFRGAHVREAVYHLTRILDQCEGCPPELQALLYRRIGGACWVMRDDRRAIESAERALALSREHGNLAGIAASTSLLGQISRPVDPDLSVAQFSQALAISEELGNAAEAEGYIEFNMSQRALSLILAGNLSRARQDVTAVLERIDQVKDSYYFSFALCLLTLINLLERNYDEAQEIFEVFRLSNQRARDRELNLSEHRLMGELAIARGDAALALSNFQQAFELATSFDALTRGNVLSQIAKATAALGDLDRAVRLWGAAESMLDASGVTAITRLTLVDLLGTTALRDALSSHPRLATAFEEGRVLAEVDTYALAMNIVTTGPAATAKGRLTNRQIEVLELIAQGCTNREIGERLYISTRTVDRHVATLLDALGVSTRREALSEARKRRLIPSLPQQS